MSGLIVIVFWIIVVVVAAKKSKDKTSPYKKSEAPQKKDKMTAQMPPFFETPYKDVKKSLEGASVLFESFEELRTTVKKKSNKKSLTEKANYRLEPEPIEELLKEEPIKAAPLKATPVKAAPKKTTAGNTVSKKAVNERTKKQTSILERATRNVQQDFAKDVLEESQEQQELLNAASYKVQSVQEKKNKEPESEDLLKQVQDLMITGPNVSTYFERDFIAEGIEMINRSLERV